MLAAWHRYKSPHLTVGAIASGAPVDFYPAAVTSGDETQAKFDDAWLTTWADAGDSLSETSAGANAGAGSEEKGWCRTAVIDALDTAGAGSAEDLEKAGMKTCGATSGADTVEKFLFYTRGALSR